MNFNTRVTNFILLILILNITGCVLLPKPKFDPNDLNSSVVFGYIDTKNMPSEFGGAKIQGLGGEDDYVTASTYKGAFWHIAVRPGYRQVRSFSGFSSRNIFGHGDAGNIYSFGEKDSKSMAIKIKKPGIHFFGSYKFIMHKDDKFNVRRINRPLEKTVLKLVLKGLIKESGDRFYQRQIKMIKQRLRELR